MIPKGENNPPNVKTFAQLSLDHIVANYFDRELRTNPQILIEAKRLSLCRLRSRGNAVVISQQPTKPFATLYLSSRVCTFVIRFHVSVTQSLLISQAVTVLQVFANSVIKRTLSGQNQPNALFFLDRPYKPLHVSIQIWRSRITLDMQYFPFPVSHQTSCRTSCLDPSADTDNR